MCILGTGFLFVYYATTNYSGGLFTLKSGPIPRLILTQIATCYLHFQAFPNIHSYLNGASFPTAISWIFNTDQSWIRSGRVVRTVICGYSSLQYSAQFTKPARPLSIAWFVA